MYFEREALCLGVDLRCEGRDLADQDLAISSADVRCSRGVDLLDGTRGHAFDDRGFAGAVPYLPASALRAGQFPLGFTLFAVIDRDTRARRVD